MPSANRDFDSLFLEQVQARDQRARSEWEEKKAIEQHAMRLERSVRRWRKIAGVLLTLAAVETLGLVIWVSR